MSEDQPEKHTTQTSPVKKKKNPLAVVLIVVVVIIVLAFLAIMAGSLFFASRVAQKLKEAGVQVNPGANSLTVKGTKNGESFSVGQGTTLPAGFPANFPQYPSAKIMTAVVSKDGYAVNYVIQNAPGDTVITWYKQELAKNGWAVKNDTSGLNVVEFSNTRYEGTILGLSQKNYTSITLNLKKK